jgi:asparagine synthase (glutamine-hydrolysing)
MRPTLVNASLFYRAVLNPQSTVYSSSPNEVIPIVSFEDGLNPARYRSVFHPFAQVVENKARDEYLLVRDHLGLRPLYYQYQSGQLLFGETIQDIIRKLPQAPALLDSEVTHLFGDVHHYTDNTLHTGIQRVEPGYMVRILPDGRIVKSVFWKLEQEGDTLHYRDEREYLEHFTSLMQESIKNATQGSRSIAAEFSAGMDSTAVYGTCAQLELNPTLFMHSARAGSTNAQTYNDRYERAFMAQFPSATIHRLMADDFDPIRIFKEYAAWFGGPSPYVFDVFTHNIHKAISKQGHTILLSGFGGDQCVSSHVPARFILPSLINNKQFRQAWAESAPATTIRRLAQLIQYAHPSLHKLIQYVQDLKLSLSNTLKPSNQQRAASTHPYHRHYFKTLREVEWSFLQGPNSHEVRMRIEYSSIVAKKMGFDYRYPLLHPKLLEFFLSLPLEQKRHQGVDRHMMRRYLAKIMPTVPFDTYKKKEGLNIMPATMDTFKAQWNEGLFQTEFHSLPKTLTQDKSPHKTMIKTIQAFMLNERFNHTPLHDRRKG